MKLKVGDKVRVVKSLDFPDIIGKVYEVNMITGPSSAFACRIKQGMFDTLMYDWEIEKIATKNQQLLFSFMNEQ